VDLGGIRPAHLRHTGADDGLFRATGDSFRVAWGEPVEDRQEGPLILVWLQGRQVEEERKAVFAAPTLQRRGDQVAEPSVG
jgi:hypothetical protein